MCLDCSVPKACVLLKIHFTFHKERLPYSFEIESIIYEEKLKYLSDERVTLYLNFAASNKDFKQFIKLKQTIFTSLKSGV